MVTEEVARERIAVIDETAAIDKPQKITGIVLAKPEGREEAAIIPVVEEVVEKRLKLVEDVRVTKQQITKHKLQNITLRRQNLVLERLLGPDDGELN